MGTDGSFRLGPGVQLDDDARVGAFCILGLDGPQSAPLSIGQGCHIRSHSVIYRGSTFGKNFSTGHGVLIREFCDVGDRCSIGSHTVLEHHVTVGDDVRVHSGCFIPEYSRLEAGCWIGPHVTVTNAKYPNRPDTKENLLGVMVASGAVVGAAAVLLPGVTVGKGAIVGAGAVVVRDVLPGTVVAGNPARDIR